MTKVQVTFKILGSLDDAMLAKLSDMQAIYGIDRITFGTGMKTLSVEYDATRLQPVEVESTLRQRGIPLDTHQE